MKTESFLEALAYIAKRLGIAEIVILTVTGLVWWWLGWRTLADYSTALKWAGLAIIFFGATSFFGGTNLNRNPTYLYTQSVMPNSAHDRAQQNFSDMTQGMSFTVWAGLAGIITIGLGYLLRSFLG
jgi:hypothetical protein